MNERCDGCIYWKKRFTDSVLYGYCYRFPERVEKDWDDWCGEFKQK
jgi:hypothetical protein